MPKPKRLIARYRDPIPHEDDVQQIVTKLGGLGYVISRLDAATAWRQFSEAKIRHAVITDDGVEAKWVPIPDAAADVWHNIAPYVMDAR